MLPLDRLFFVQRTNQIPLKLHDLGVESSIDFEHKYCIDNKESATEVHLIKI
jgi:hypothetical protein